MLGWYPTDFNKGSYPSSALYPDGYAFNSLFIQHFSIIQVSSSDTRSQWAVSLAFKFNPFGLAFRCVFIPIGKHHSSFFLWRWMHGSNVRCVWAPKKKTWQVAFAVLLNMYDSFPQSWATIPFQISIILHLLSRNHWQQFFFDYCTDVETLHIVCPAPVGHRWINFQKC